MDFSKFLQFQKNVLFIILEYFLYFSSLDQIDQQSCFDSVYPRSVEEAFLQIRRSFLFTVPSHTIFPFHSFSLITLGNYITTRLSRRFLIILTFNCGSICEHVLFVQTTNFENAYIFFLVDFQNFTEIKIYRRYFFVILSIHNPSLQGHMSVASAYIFLARSVMPFSRLLDANRHPSKVYII